MPFWRNGSAAVTRLTVVPGSIPGDGFAGKFDRIKVLTAAKRRNDMKKTKRKQKVRKQYSLRQ